METEIVALLLKQFGELERRLIALETPAMPTATDEPGQLYPLLAHENENRNDIRTLQCRMPALTPTSKCQSELCRERNPDKLLGDATPEQ
jgi:hypothetical protein